jgi:hypothetical protein
MLARIGNKPFPQPGLRFTSIAAGQVLDLTIRPGLEGHGTTPWRSVSVKQIRMPGERSSLVYPVVISR